MIYAMTRDLEEALRAKYFPIRCLYDDGRAERLVEDPLVVVSRDRQAGDTYAGPRGSQPNPRSIGSRALGVVIHCYMRSELAGAGLHDHEASCDQLVDAVVLALDRWAVASRLVGFTVASGRYLQAAERNDVELWPGVVYELRVRVPRALLDRDYTLSGHPVAPIASVSTITTAARAASAAPPVTP